MTDEVFLEDSLPSDEELSKIEKAACEGSQTAENGFSETEIVFQLYWNEVSSIPLLSAEREKELFSRIADGDEDAKTAVTEANLRLVVFVASKYRNSPLDFTDLVQEGNLGLMRAVEKFDASRGFRFSTYATWWIRKYILEAISRQVNLISLPDSALSRIRKFNAAVEKLEKQFGGAPTDEMLAYELNMPLEKITETRLLASGSILPLNALSDVQVEDEGGQI